MLGSLGGFLDSKGFAVSVNAIFSSNTSPLINGINEMPSNADLVIETEKHSIDEEVTKILQYLKSRELITTTDQYSYDEVKQNVT